MRSRVASDTRVFDLAPFNTTETVKGLTFTAWAMSFKVIFLEVDEFVAMGQGLPGDQWFGHS
jgi:hypothetical protein